jgi:acyl-CoA synthetase (NDP forming)
MLERGGGWATAHEANALLTGVGIRTAPARVVGSGEAAVAAATEIGYPVVLKALGPTLLHKTERGAVRVNLRNAEAVGAAYEDFTTRLGSEMTAALLQQMVPPGIEMIVGAVQDPVFGPLIACGTGGVLVDLLADTAFRLHPLSHGDAVDLVNELRGARLLRGYRGAPPVDEPALRDVLLRISELVTIAPEIQELDLNPVVVLPSGACVADARVRAEPVTPQRPGRRLDY